MTVDCRRHRPRLARHSEGFTLVELLIVMAILSLVITFVAVGVISLWRARGDLERAWLINGAMMRLSRQLRSDAHTAASARRESTGANTENVIVLSGQGMDVEYTREAQRVVRVARKDGRVLHREIYWLGDVSTSWQLTDSVPRWLTVTFTHPNPAIPDLEPDSYDERLEIAIGIFLEAR